VSATDEAMAEAERVVRARALALAETIAPAHLALGVGATLRPDVLEPTSPRVHASLPPVAVDRPGQAVEEGADLELVSELGRGGMGVVWQARQRSLGRDVAIKRVTSLESVHAVEALLGEARTMGRLEHPSIVPVHALGASAEGPLLVMKRIEGTSLEALLRDASHPAWPALERRHGERLLAYVEILSRVCDALELAHARGVVHCDLKPENVMIGSFGETYLLDWGVARSFRGPDVEVGIAGTPSYMAPEMLAGRSGALGPHTDVYLLGGTLHAMLTGRPLHEGESFQEVLTKAALSEPRSYPPTISADLVSLVHEATRREPSARVPDAATFRARLGEVRAHRASIALTDDVRARLDRFASSLDVAADRRAFLLGDEAGRALAGARFGATHALASWSDNAAARRELDRALGWLAELELARESPEAAAALARERTSEDPALAARIEEARARASTQKSLAARAAAEAVDQDPSVRGGTRALALVVLALVSVAVNFLVIGSGGSDARAEILTGIGIDALQLGLVGVAVLAFRKRLLANRWGRRAVALLFVAGAALVVAGVGIWLRGGSELDETIGRDVVLGSVFAAAAVSVTWRLWVPAAFAGLATVLGSASPELAPVLTFATMMLGVLAVVSESVRPSRSRDGA
jgi:tRNA A-37 threonylcarbamoyl transferase component Bud32